ncbi:YajQ family cyclic di-GMP-binding protein [Candidatus Sumerlaeota bacterium]|nr:YajQ family cyclic di-GMP-binding protein [Candidatus Sumerlaeota bacterium]
MPSFDIVNQVDLQEADNAVNNTKKELESRWDFRNTKTEISFDRKEKVIKILTADTMKMDAIKDILIGKCVKRGVDPKCLQWGEVEAGAMGQVKREVKLREGIEKDVAREIVKLIKEQKLKVQPAIQEDQVRVSGKQIDDLQEVIKVLRGANIEVPLQFVNMKK